MATKWFNVNWSYRNKFTIKHTGTALSNFPVTINVLPASGHYIRFDLMQTTGADIRFCDGDGCTELNFEIERCNIWNQILTCHVKIPTLSGSVTAQPIYMYYGNQKAAAKAASWAQNVWDANFVAVWHMGETTGAYLDSTANGLNSGSISGFTTVPLRSVQMVGYGPDGVNAFNPCIDMYRPAALNNINPITAECFAQIGLGGTPTYAMIEKNVWYLRTAAGKIRFYHGFSTANGTWDTNSAYWAATNQKRHVAATYDSSSINNDPTIYVDGASVAITEVGTPNGTASTDATKHLRLVRQIDGGVINYWYGTMDEIRLSNIQRSATWIAATARTLRGQMVSKANTLEYCPASGNINGWWNNSWNHRKRIYSDAWKSTPYASGSHFLKVRADLASLYAIGRCNKSYSDVRIVKQVPSGFEQVARYIASGVSPQWIYFPCQCDLPSGIDIGSTNKIHYYMYYGNGNPGSTKNWVNKNFPQAPYSVITEANKTPSGYYDRFFLRLNEGAGTNITDYTNHFTGAKTPAITGAGMRVGDPGRLDRAVYFGGDSGDLLKIPGRHYCNGSGLWTMDMWIRSRHYNNYANTFCRPTSTSTSNPAHQIQGKQNIKTAGAALVNTQIQYDNAASLTSNQVPGATSGAWYFIRTIFHDAVDFAEIWIGTSGTNLTKIKSGSLSFTPVASDNTSPFILGGNYTSNYAEGDLKYRYQGWMEQVRFGRCYTDLAVSGLGTAATPKWFKPPDWIKNEYITKLDVEENVPVSAPTSGVWYPFTPKFGGYLTSDAKIYPTRYFGAYLDCRGYLPVPDHYLLGGLVNSKISPEFGQYALFGGLLRGIELICPVGVCGGYISSIVVKDRPAVYVGGYTDGRYEKSAYFGGFAYGHPSNTQCAEAHARALVKANSRQVVGQDINLDAQVIFKGLQNSEFNAKFVMFNTDFAQFAGKVEVQKYKVVPTVQITSVTPTNTGLVNGARKVTVSATGTKGDGEWQSAYIDFGDPISSTSPLIYNNNASISGFETHPVWTSTHDYHASGVYNIVVRAIDSNGCIGSDVAILNLASGLVAGVDYPKIDIGATPRQGFVPDPLRVDFHVHCSGAVPSLSTPSDTRLLWNFGNLETSRQQSPTTYYGAPGRYTATLRMRYVRPDGKVVFVSDSLLLGFNN